MKTKVNVIILMLPVVLFLLFGQTVSAIGNDPNPPPQPIASDLSNVTLSSDITANVKAWPASINLSVNVTQDTVNYSYDKMDLFTPVTTINSVGNGWLFIYRGSGWIATTVNNFRPNHGNDYKSITDEILCGGIGGTPTFSGTFVPVQGEQYGFMVSGQARAGASPALVSEEQRSNVVMATWNSTHTVGNCGQTGGGGPGGTVPTGPTGAQGPCPAGYIVLAGANASAVDPANNGFYCDNDPVEVTGVTYPVQGIMACDSNDPGDTVFLTVGYVRCQTWDFSSGTPVYQQSLIQSAACGSNVPVSIPNDNVSAGAFTKSPSVEGAVCIPGVAVSTTDPDYDDPPMGGTGGGTQPLIVAPGQTLIIFGTGLGTRVVLTPTSTAGSVVKLNGLVDDDRAALRVQLPINLVDGVTYNVTVNAGKFNFPRQIKVAKESLFAPNKLPPNPATARSLGELIQYIFLYSLYLVGLSVFVMIFWAGFLWFTSAGNAGQISNARSKIFNAIIGAIILLAAYLIMYTINPDLVRGNFNVPGVPNQADATCVNIGNNCGASDAKNRTCCPGQGTCTAAQTTGGSSTCQ